MKEHVYEQHVVVGNSLTCNWDSCDKLCAKRGNMKSHIRKHIPWNPYRCKVCERTYRRLESMRRHPCKAQCYFCRKHNENTKFVGLDRDLTGKWLCTPCRPCSRCGDYEDNAIYTGSDPKLGGEWHCRNCRKGGNETPSLSSREGPPSLQLTPTDGTHDFKTPALDNIDET